MNEKERSQQINQLRKVLKKQPQARIFAVLADLLRQSSDFKSALQVCQYGLNYHPQFSKAYVVLGRIYYDQQDYTQAATSLEIACELEPDNVLALRYLGKSYLQLKDVPNSLKVHEQILLYYPDVDWAQDLIKNLSQIYSDNDHQFSVEPIEDISKYLNKKELYERPLLRPYKASRKGQEEEIYKEITAPINRQEELHPQKTSTLSARKERSEDTKIKKLQELIDKLAPSSTNDLSI